jgi:hypothetical protein
MKHSKTVMYKLTISKGQPKKKSESYLYFQKWFFNEIVSKIINTIVTFFLKKIQN